MVRTAEVNFRIELDDKNIPVGIEWNASDAPDPGSRKCDAIQLSIWDPKDRNTLCIDLWTRDMTVDEMNFFTLQSLVKIGETYRRATSNHEIADLLDGFCQTLMTKLEETSREQKKDQS